MGIRDRIFARPSRRESLAAMTIGLLITAIGYFALIPRLGFAGLIWTDMAVVVTVGNAISALRPT